jgi:hypothetical protein
VGYYAESDSGVESHAELLLQPDADADTSRRHMGRSEGPSHCAASLRDMTMISKRCGGYKATVVEAHHSICP